MYGKDCLPKAFKGNALNVVVGGKTACVDLKTLQVECAEDEEFQNIIKSVVTRLHDTLRPINATLDPTS